MSSQTPAKATDKDTTPADPGRGARARGRTLRRFSNPRTGVIATLIALFAAFLPIALQPARGTPLATWNLPYPQTMSYRVLSEDRNISCNPTDAVFQQQVAAEGLDKYEIDMVAGQRGTCGREKGEQFKRLYPDKMVVLYEDTAGADPLTWPGGTWAGYYLMMNRTRANSAVNATQTSIPVANPGAFSVGDTAVMWSPTGGDPYANSEWVSVKSIVGSTLVVTRDFFATGAQSYATAPLIAAEATGSSYPNPVINFSDVAPVNPANGLRANQWMAQNIINDFAPSTAGAPTLDAVEFDGASWEPPVQNANGTAENVDCDGNGAIDYCNRNVGTAQQDNSYGVGYDSFVQAVKQGLTVYDTDPSRPPKMVLADGEQRGDTAFRSMDNANGVEFESFPDWDNYANSSPALSSLGIWESQDTAPGSHLSYAFTKDITPVYPESSPTNPNGCITPANGGTCRNAEFRYGMAAALLTGGASAYNNEENFLTPQPWDEEATIHQSTTGLTPGYLGQPLGPPTRTTRFSSGNLSTNPSYETDLNSVTSFSTDPAVVAVSQDTTTAAPGLGSTSLRADVTEQTADPSQGDARVNTGVNGSISPGEYTVDFWAKATNNVDGPQALNLGVSLTGVTGGAQSITLTNNWTHYYLQVDASTEVTKNAAVKFFVGTQIGTYWLDGVNVHRGTAGLLTREFTNGIVVLNDSFTAQTDVPLPDGPYHHITGAQDRSVNDGSNVGSLLPSIASKDGEILLRGSGSVVATIVNGGVSIAWTPPGANTPPIDAYSVTSYPSGHSVTVPGDQTHATFVGLAAGSWTFQVHATDASGNDVWTAASNRILIAALKLARSGYWMLGSGGKVYAFGNATNPGSAPGPAVAISARLDGGGYWITDAAGNVSHFGTAASFGGHPALRAGEVVSTISATPSGNGYWLFTNRGRAFAYGDAHFYGDMSGTTLNGPIIASVATATGHGYYMVASDGGVFSFGDARFHGSTGAMHLNRPVVGISPTPDNRGYWLVASDGGVFAFDAPFRGSMGATHLNKPVNGLVAYGTGYLMVASDGGIFSFSNKAFGGSLGGDPPSAPIIGVAAFAT